ncbi:MAG TPA: glycosyltransferase family 4 protein [Candidatus Bipolaricaulota bacterium]|nr:glycosyltransferase family 4 protein [Candidatus Bipolaricaulota bacterium]
MKYLIIAPRYHINLHDRILALKNAGHFVDLIVQYKGKSEKYDLIDPEIIGYSRVYLFFEKIFSKFKKTYLKNSWELKLSLPPLRKFKKRIKEINPDVIMVKGLKSLFSLCALKYAKRFKIKSIVFIQRDRFRCQRLKEKFVCWFLFKHYQVKAVASPICRKSGRDEKSHEKFHYIPFVYDIVDFEKSYFKNVKMNILNIGKFEPIKDQLTLLKAVEKLKSFYPMKIVLVGEKADPNYILKLMDFVKENKMEDIVEFKFDAPHAEVIELYRQSDLFVLTSLSDPASFQILEAMANKVPVISSDKNGTKCYIKEGETGYIFKAGDADDLARKIESVIDDKDDVINFGRAGFEQAKKNHSLEKFSQKIKAILS